MAETGIETERTERGRRGTETETEAADLAALCPVPDSAVTETNHVTGKKRFIVFLNVLLLM